MVNLVNTVQYPQLVFVFFITKTTDKKHMKVVVILVNDNIINKQQNVHTNDLRMTA